MREFINAILGAYEPVSYVEERYVFSAEQPDVVVEMITGEIIPAGLAGVDWSYVITGLVFVVVVYCLFKTLGGMICRTF